MNRIESSWPWIVALLLTTAAFAASAALYPGLPDRIPTHWDIQGQVDGYGSKATIFLLPATMAFMVALFAGLSWLSPKGYEVDTFRPTVLYLLVVVVGLFGYMHGLTLYAALRGPGGVGRALVGGVLLMLALMGNVLGKVRPNFYIGVRTPWTLASPRVWADTHRLAAWLFVAVGLVGFALVLAGANLIVPFVLLIAGAAATVLYSLVHYKRLERQGLL
jgi:uncharacterized membrane protein